jgi:trk system potassium uptake protein
MNPTPSARLAERARQFHNWYVLQRRHFTITLRIIFGLMGLVVVGTFLLMLPAVAAEEPLTFTEALFTATSAVTVTGLTVVTTGTHFNLTGHLIILALIQVGGVGYMFSASLALRFLGHHLSYTERLTLSTSLGLDSPSQIVQTLKQSFYGLLVIEGVGTLLLFWHWRANDMVPVESSLLFALFHAISALANAGFDLFNGLPLYPDGVPVDNVTLLIMGVLIFIGGLGIPVLAELLTWRRRRFYSLHTRLTLVVVTVLVIVGWLGLLLVETRGGVLQQVPTDQQIVQSWFQSISARTAGFSGFVDFDQITPASQVLIMALMFIGTAPASMGGGITTGTFIVLVLAVWSYVRGLSEVHVGHRSISLGAVRRAAAVLTVGLGAVFLSTWAILATHDLSLSPALFEVISAFATTGLSLGATEELNTFGRLVIVAMMFWGRLGALTIVVAIAEHTSKSEQLIHYPEESVLL